MRHPSTKALYAYWLRLKGPHAAPQRSALDPRELAAHLGDIFVLDGAASGHGLRLAGARMEAGFGASLVGKPFITLFSAACRSEAMAALALARDQAEPVVLGVRLSCAQNSPQDETALVLADRGPERNEAAHRWVSPMWHNYSKAHEAGRRRQDAGPRRQEAGPGRQEARETQRGSGEMLLLPLIHRGVTGARILGGFGLTLPPQQRAACQGQLDIVSERVLGPQALARRGRDLAPGAMLIAGRAALRFLHGDETPSRPGNDR